MIISHRFCSDGLVAAAIILRKYPDAECVFLNPGDPPPNVIDKEVYIVDFSFKRDVLLDMKSKAKSLLVLDHHKSAQKELAGLEEFCIFDMNRSGCGLAHDYFFPDEHRHWITNYTETKDLWRFDLPYSYEINAVLQSRPLTFESLYELENKVVEDLLEEGKILLMNQQFLVQSLAKNAYVVEVCGHKIYCCNSPVYRSELGHLLAQDMPFAIVYYINSDGNKICSLRSAEDGFDVSEIAFKMANGGGGHFHSAGAKITKENSLYTII